MAWLPTLLFRYWSVRGKSTPAAGPADLLGIQAGEGQIGAGVGRILRSNCEKCPGLPSEQETEVNRAISRLQHQNIVGRAQVGRVGFGRDETPHLWWRATKKQHKATVIEEIPHHQQIDQRNYLGEMPQPRFSFLLRATYNTLP